MPESPNLIVIDPDQLAELDSDRARLEWVLPILSCSDLPESFTDSRVVLIAGSLMLGKTGREAIDAAMDAEAKAVARA